MREYYAVYILVGYNLLTLYILIYSYQCNNHHIMYRVLGIIVTSILLTYKGITF